MRAGCDSRRRLAAADDHAELTQGVILAARAAVDSVGCGLGTGAVTHGVQVLGGAGQTDRKALDTLASGATWLSGGHPGGVAGRGNIDHVLKAQARPKCRLIFL